MRGGPGTLSRMTASVDSAEDPLRPATDRARESHPRKRRLSLAGLLVLAFLLGSTAAALPSLWRAVGEESPALRALGAAVASLVLGCAIGTRIGSDIQPEDRRARWSGVVALALSLVVIQLPASFAGSDLGLTRELSAQLQSFLGWRHPVPLPAVLVALVLISWSAGRLVAVREKTRARSRIEWFAVVLLYFTVAAIAVLLLSSCGAVDGRERTTKLLAFGLVAALAATAAGRSAAGSTRLARFVFVLCCASGASSVFALSYVTPSPRHLVGLELEVESEGWTIVAGPLRGRTDVHGVFVLPPGGRRLELLEVRPGPADLFDYRPPQIVDGGLARRVGDGDVASIYSDDVDRDRGRGEIRIRSRRFPFLDRATGFELEDDVIAWTLAPSGRYLVLARQIRSEPSAARGLSTAPRPPRFRLELRWHAPWRSNQILLDDQGALARVIALDDLAIRFLRNGTASNLSVPSYEARHSAWTTRDPAESGLRTSSLGYLQPRYLAIDSYDLSEGRWIQGPRSDYTVGQELHFLAGRREAVVGCSAASLGSHQSGTCRISLETLELRGRTGAIAATSGPVNGKTVPLSGSRLGVVWYVGGNPSRPRRDWRFTTFHSSGRELATVRIGEGDFFLPSRELEDGTLAIARPPEPTPALRKQVFEWTLESLNLVTGARRTIAKEVAPARIRHDESPDLFLTRDGRIVLPTATGLHDVTRGPRSEVAAPPSTGLTSTTTRAAPRRSS